MAGSSHEKVLAAEWLVVMATETLDALDGADTGHFALPEPSRYFAAMVVYMMLAAAALFGDKAGRLASAFGGVAALAILIAPGKNGAKSPVIGALSYFSKIMTAGPSKTSTPSVPGGKGSASIQAQEKSIYGQYQSGAISWNQAIQDLQKIGVVGPGNP